MNKTVVLMLSAGTLTALGQIAKGRTPPASVFVGTAGAGALVLLAGVSQPELAERFALVVFLTALMTSGYDVAAGINRAVGANKPAAPAPVPTKS